jgi:heptosyltransferase-2
VIQPLPGIGDMVWHVPHIRAIAAHASAPVALLAKPRSLADQLLASEPAVSNVIWVDLNPAGRRGTHDGIAGFRRLVQMLRQHDFATIILLHHSDLLAAAAWIARIPDRRGYGLGRQRWFLNNGPFLGPEAKNLHQHTRATRYLRAANIPIASTEPRLTVPPDAPPNPLVAYVAIGIGSSEPLRQWGHERLTELARALLQADWPLLILVGGSDDNQAALTILKSLDNLAPRVLLALGWDLGEVMSLLAGAVFYVGNNTGVMNIAAAVGTRTYALFGSTQPFDHASQIIPVTAPNTGMHDGMARLTLSIVLDAIRADRGRLTP